MSHGKSKEDELQRISKNQLVKMIGNQTGIKQHDVRQVINQLCTLVIHNVAVQGGKVVLHGFGTFSQRSRSGRSYRHPTSGQTCRSKPSQYMYFEQSRSLAHDEDGKIRNYLFQGDLDLKNS